MPTHLRPDSSPPSSPIRKRQRLSSPTYDQQLGDLSQEDLAAYDELEYRLSQSSQSPKKADSENTSLPFFDPEPLNLLDDSDNPFDVSSTAYMNVNATSTLAVTTAPLGFSTASALHVEKSYNTYERSPSPEEPPEQDFSAWFEPATNTPLIAFQAPSASLVSPKALGPIGFAKASHKGFIVPSGIAFANARAKMQNIWKEVDSERAPSTSRPIQPPREESENMPISALSLPSKPSPRRLALRAVENSPGTPSPTGFSRPTLQQNALASSPATDLFVKKYSKPFKSPLLPRNTAVASSCVSSPLNPASRSLDCKLPIFSSAGSQNYHLGGSTPVSVLFSTPNRPSARIPVAAGGVARRPFTTPFKDGMKPGDLHARPEETFRALQSTAPASKSERDKQAQLININQSVARTPLGRKKVTHLTRGPDSTVLASAGLIPQQYTHKELENMGINVGELSQITPNLALYYAFHSSIVKPISATPSSPPVVVMGPEAALDELLNKGCSLARKPWVDNHWCLILWKLAGMVALEPHVENTDRKRWCWAEVMRQLLYRYERELNCGKRPALRLITTQDAPAGYPMVLCVSNVIWSAPDIAQDGTPIEPHPELEVTDGWYRLRAQVDAPLARAIRRGIIRIGRKIGVAGARLFSEKKEPSEVLEAYNSTKLIISGNSSHLAPWHAKLGFSTGPCVSTLHSLTNDGGLVAVLDVVVVKVHPLAFFEFFEDEDGKKRCEGPRNQSEEAAVQERWKRRWELEMSKLRLELENKWNRYEGYINRLERRAGSQLNVNEDDCPPDVIENMYDELEDQTAASRVLGELGAIEAGWLARYIRERMAKERANAQEELENEVKHLCSPREVRNFRVIIAEDACTRRRPPNRKAQLTVWDVLNLAFSEGAALGAFEVGQRYTVTNLTPTQHSAWMDCEPGSEIFLATRRDSRWTQIKN